MKDLPPNVQLQFEGLSRCIENEYSSEELSLLRQVLDVCESPIEQLFLLGIARHWASTHPFRVENTFGLRSNLINFISLDYQGDIDVTIYPQHWIKAGEKFYRADLLLRTHGKGLLQKLDNSKQVWQVCERDIRIVVEIDGHHFHERTKAQAQHDKSRDRILNKYDYIVLHYTGSEVFADVYNATRELAEFVFAKLFLVSNVYDLFYEL